MARHSLNRARTAGLARGVIFALLVPASAAQGGPESCSSFRRGDTNGDGDFHFLDCLETLSFLFVGGPAPACMDAADADDSGDLDLGDALYGLQYLFGHGPPPRLPGPFDCGRDDTFDPLGCLTYAPCAPVPAARDFSGFGVFRYTLNGALGFCADPGEVLDAVITRQPSGLYQLEISTVGLGQPGDPGCLEGGFEEPCLVRVPQNGRDLRPQEVGGMIELFSSLEVTEGPDPICNCVAIDPCRINSYEWDAEVVIDFLCGDRRLELAGAEAIRGFLRGLAESA